jgi:hypothetical protein
MVRLFDQLLVKDEEVSHYFTQLLRESVNGEPSGPLTHPKRSSGKTRP